MTWWNNPGCGKDLDWRCWCPTPPPSVRTHNTHTYRKDGPCYTRSSFDTQDSPPWSTTPLQRCQRWTLLRGQTQYVTFDPSRTLELQIIRLVLQDGHTCVWCVRVLMHADVCCLFLDLFTCLNNVKVQFFPQKTLTQYFCVPSTIFEFILAYCCENNSPKSWIENYPVCIVVDDSSLLPFFFFFPLMNHLPNI